MEAGARHLFSVQAKNGTLEIGFKNKVGFMLSIGKLDVCAWKPAKQSKDYYAYFPREKRALDFMRSRYGVYFRVFRLAVSINYGFDCAVCRDADEKCQECCPHDERDHGICYVCEHEEDPGAAIDHAYEMMRDR